MSTFPTDSADDPDWLVRQAWFLTGATAAGKTAVGIELARLLGGEIVSMDSMAVYRGMDLGTAKPTPAERAAVPHHLLDVVEPEEEFSLARYVAAAHRAARQIVARGRRPLLVGGTPLYLKSLLRGIFAGPPADWTLRHELAEVAQREGPAALHARLAAVDPGAARRLHPGDARRIVRALEVYAQTGQPISALQRQFDRARPAAECHVFVLDWPRDELVGRIDARVEAMFAAGLVEEVRALSAGGSLSRTAREAVGYRETLAHLAGDAPLAETISKVKVRTRQFAKRQLTWFRSLSECRWVRLQSPLDAAAVARRLLAENATSG